MTTFNFRGFKLIDVNYLKTCAASFNCMRHDRCLLFERLLLWYSKKKKIWFVCVLRSGGKRYFDKNSDCNGRIVWGFLLVSLSIDVSSVYWEDFFECAL